MIYLGIETSGTIGDICILDTETGKQLSRELTTVHKISEVLTSEISSLLNDFEISLKDINIIVVGIGPGSYTGTRIGVATAKGLAHPFNTKIIGVSSVDGLAESYKIEKGENGRVYVFLDAKNGRIYHNLDHDIKCDDVSTIIVGIEKNSVVIGTGANVYRELINKTGVKIDETFARDVKAVDLCIAAQKCAEEEKYDDVESLKPLYVNPPNIGVKK